MTSGLAMGIDIGGSGIKGGVVDLAAGELVGERFRLDTPRPATPAAVGDTLVTVSRHFEGFAGPVGVDYPGVVVDGVALTAANMDPAWIGTPFAGLVGDRLPGPASYLNDADAAGLAEVRFGAGRGRTGLIAVITFGTGIGVALIHQGQLVPNAELGHLEMNGRDAETQAAASARTREGLDFDVWAGRVSQYLRTFEGLLWPELFILGGGISKKAKLWMPLLECRTPCVPAELKNEAGIVGAALFAAEAAAS